MIYNFKCKQTEELWMTGKNKKFPPDLLKNALRKLWMLDNADDLIDLRVPPSNRLEQLYGDRKQQYSIRVNLQWRICFIWKNKMAYDVEMVDYH
jgi:proteic killer suppression protein